MLPQVLNAWNDPMLTSLQELEVECELQRTLRDEAEVAMKLLEKDIHEKQDSILSMRRQLEDIKAINLQLYNKLQVSLFFSWDSGRDGLSSGIRER